MKVLLILPFILQGIVISLDEFIFHLKRNLPRWERIGHPIDSFFYFLPITWTIFFSPTKENVVIFIVMACLSTLIIIKDEKIHKELSSGNEQFLHALLFIFHPVCLLNVFYIWPILHGINSPLLGSFKIYEADYLNLKMVIYFQAISSAVFCFYQIIYWNFIKKDD